MKKTELEKKLEAQEFLRLCKYETTSDPKEQAELLNEIERLNKMRDMLEAHRVDNRNSWSKTLVQTGVPLVATVLLAVVGYASEQNIGNPTGFTLKWLINRAPR